MSYKITMTEGYQVRERIHHGWRCWSLLIVLSAAWPCAARSQGCPAPKQRVLTEAAKQEQLRDESKRYVWCARHTIDKAWKSSHQLDHDKLLETRVKVTLEASGKPVACTVLSSSGSEQEDVSAQECVNATAFAVLPPGLNTCDFFWTLMSDGNVNTVVCTDSPEANTYYTKLVGETVPPMGATATQANSWCGPYIADVQRRIKRAWFPKGHESDPVVVVFKLQHDGKLANLRLENPSGIAGSDQAALKAVVDAAPYRPFPAYANLDDVEVQFTFDYNQFNGGGHGIFVSF